MTDFNRADESYTYKAVRGDTGWKGLPERLSAFADGLQAQLRSRPPKDSVRSRTLGCMDRLRSFIIQVERIAGHASHLRRVAEQVAAQGDGVMCAYAARPTLTDFESLLFHGRAVLDRFAWFVSGEHRLRCHYSSLASALRGSVSEKDPRRNELLSLVDWAAPLFADVLVDSAGDAAEASWRSQLAHYESIVETIRNDFTFHSDRGHVIVFDCETERGPILGTAHAISQAVPYVILNGLAAYSGWDERLTPELCFPEWENPAVVFSAHHADPEAGQRFSLLKLTLDGFELVQSATFSSEVYEKAAIKPDPGPEVI